MWLIGEDLINKDFTFDIYHSTALTLQGNFVAVVFTVVYVGDALCD